MREPRDLFHLLAKDLGERLKTEEVFAIKLSGEQSNFVRFNHGRVRQAGEVRQAYLTLQLIRDAWHVSQTLALSGRLENDLEQVTTVLPELRRRLEKVPEDPHLLLPDQVQNTERLESPRLPSAEQMVADISAAAGDSDLVGILAAGPVWHGFANSQGQRNWHETTSFNFDFSLHGAADQAVKRSFSGLDWAPQTVAASISQARTELELLRRPPRSLEPGVYRAYLAPSALGEIVGMFNWEGFSENALRTKRSALARLADDRERFSPLLNLAEHPALGLAPGFQSAGFVKPPRVPLIAEGRLVGSLVSPRTAREYGISSNGAEADESANALDMGAGELAMSDALRTLGTGLCISNLWYLNYSDRPACRITGMTRFASFWVERGEIAAPLKVARFDDSVYRLLGDELLALTREREFLVDPGTYGARSLSSLRLPGALVSSLRFVL